MIQLTIVSSSFANTTLTVLYTDEQPVRDSMALSPTELKNVKYYEEEMFIATSSPTDV